MVSDFVFPLAGIALVIDAVLLYRFFGSDAARARAVLNGFATEGRAR